MIGAGMAALAIAPASALVAQAGGASPTELFWGELHLHSNHSLDAYITDNTMVTPDMAYRYARGIPIEQPGLDRKIQIRRPLDFMAVTDHAEMMGLFTLLNRADETLLATPWGRRAMAAHVRDPARGAMSVTTAGMAGPPVPELQEMMGEIYSDAVRSTAWAVEIEAAERNYVPGTFTTMFGWEWSSVVDGGKNLHRIVLANTDGEGAGSFIPYSSQDSQRPEDLWSWMSSTRDRTGIDFIAIPHNSNISGGLMFQMTDSDGRPISAAYARARQQWEPLVEVTQAKGTSEVHPEIAPNDEFADFEIRRKLLIGTPTPADEGDYARSALQRGLQIQERTGVNPYNFGMIGSTDSHTGLSSVQESDFYGKLVSDIPLSSHVIGPRPVIFPAWEMGASGRVAAWAEENTREGIFAALRRKEVYATTGPRIALRMFGGFNFSASDADARDIAALGYARGIPMGGDLTAAPAGRAPSLLILAAKDPLSGNLDRVQVVKGWVDADGEAHEHVYDVAWSDDRRIGPDGKLPAVGNTVDLETGLYTNSIGAVQLATVWTDPDFDPQQAAFYYVRVLEIPTPRHSLLDAIALGIDVEQTGQPATIQERAYSSPIWYTPARR
ncbi:DUF3604 domain-containing protein [Alteraurantiacibacter aquimixticola]|uniref:DUF3604 domain-containing protein n=1 Tax=Alteraurantiacibacter aquimixticola TaxID=2489173 RepID=A0A4T3F4V3_9SPHN|nr:DUF3604 domain-containing protein [Alteraurantiacibacter aquimixticola]TIX51499.1 DUF3604 domain-containing protein [Alteraurantiacibacter aquimixticola]